MIENPSQSPNTMNAITQRVVQSFLNLFRNFRVAIVYPTGIRRERTYSFCRSLQIMGLMDDTSAESRLGTDLNTHDFADSSLRFKVFKNALSLSFPTHQQVSINDECIYKGMGSPSLQRITLNRPWAECQQLNFLSPSGAVIQIEPSIPDVHDLKQWLNANSTPVFVVAGHIAVLALMAVSFAMPATKALSPLPDVSQVQVTLRYSDTGAVVGMPTQPSGVVVTREMAALQKSLKNFKINKTHKSSGRKFEGFVSSLSAQSQGSSAGFEGRIGFSAAGSEEETKPLNLTAQQLSAVFDSVNPQLKECYDDVLVRDASLQGRPQVIVQVAEEGSVQDVGIQYLQGRSNALSMLHDCFRRTFRTVKFPKANQAFAVTQTLVLVR